MSCRRCTGYLPPFEHFATSAIHFGQEPEQWSSWAVVPPITLSATFKQEAPGKNKGYAYTRSGNPSRHVLEKVMTALDGAKHREQRTGLAYSSGMAAILNICHLLKPGDAIICTDDVYGGTRELFDKLYKDYNIKVDYVDCTDLKKLKHAIEQVTKLVWLETPTNPMLKVIDIKACSDVAHGFPNVLVAVDNSLMSPYFQRPLSLGADICMSSATKYINGHCDVLMGLVSVNRDDLYERLKYLQSRLGAVPSPFDCYMCNRGLKTLHIRMKLHFQNGLAVAEFLENHRRVKKVIYPGLPSHPQHEVMKRQCTGVSGVISFYIKGTKENALAFLKNLEVFTLAYNLGAYESLAEHPATMTHASVPEKIKEELGISDTLIRLSVGLEDEEDLKADLDRALEAAASKRTDERKRNSLAWTHREEQKQSHSSHKPCALFPSSMSNPWAAFGEGFHPKSQLSTHFCSILDREMGSLDSKFLDTSI
ncbi:cystathionine gamma-lyase-like [Anomalospiza imberbis]|uniref:cystathionine gamma-lyase-like n=1 Tax=Anomalospiza imberbis TaxID=187417 RepID=UPI00358E6B52